MMNSRGQSLLETLVLLPLWIALIGGLLTVCYLIFICHWFDFWVYRTNMCLAENRPPWTCRSNLVTRLNLVVPWSTYSVRDVGRTARRSQVRVHLEIPHLLVKEFVSTLNLPVRP